jgi:hypothetical protein
MVALKGSDRTEAATVGAGICRFHEHLNEKSWVIVMVCIAFGACAEIACDFLRVRQYFLWSRLKQGVFLADLPQWESGTSHD